MVIRMGGLKKSEWKWSCGNYLFFFLLESTVSDNNTFSYTTFCLWWCWKVLEQYDKCLCV